MKRGKFSAWVADRAAGKVAKLKPETIAQGIGLVRAVIVAAIDGRITVDEADGLIDELAAGAKLTVREIAARKAAKRAEA